MIDNDIMAIDGANKGGNDYEFYQHDDISGGLLGNVDDDEWKIE